MISRGLCQLSGVIMDMRSLRNEAEERFNLRLIIEISKQTEKKSKQIYSPTIYDIF